MNAHKFLEKKGYGDWDFMETGIINLMAELMEEYAKLYHKEKVNKKKKSAKDRDEKIGS